MTTATSIPTGPMALLVSLAALGAGCVITFIAVCAWLALIDRRERRRKERRKDQRPGYLPPQVARSYREPRCPDTVAGLLAYGDRAREREL